MPTNQLVVLAGLIGLFLLVFDRRKGAYLAILAVLAILIVCGCSSSCRHHH